MLKLQYLIVTLGVWNHIKRQYFLLVSCCRICLSYIHQTHIYTPEIIIYLLLAICNDICFISYMKKIVASLFIITLSNNLNMQLKFCVILSRLDLAGENVVSLSANHLQKLRLSFQLTTPLGHVFKPHQVCIQPSSVLG